MIDTASLTPAQARTWRELLDAGGPRPASDPALAPALRERLEKELVEGAALVPEGELLRVNKTALNALDCDGRYADHLDSPFEHSPRTVVGTLAHRTIQLDADGGRERDPEDVVRYAWRDLATGREWSSSYVASLGGVEADALRADVRARLLAFRECFPLLPPKAEARAEVPFVVRLAEGRIVLRGVPDLVVGQALPGERRMHLIDLKTGLRRRWHRHDLRFYALLATLKLGSAPFRVSTYYLDEADWESEDVDDDTLEAALRTVVEKVRRAAVLKFRRPEDAALGLVPGPACRWCARAPTCPAAPA